MKFILGEKKNMSQYFDEEGKVTPVTVISAEPNYITQIKTEEKDGYKSLQIGYKEGKEKRASKALRGHMGRASKNNSNSPKAFKYLKEFRVEGESDFKEGDMIDVSSFEIGDLVKVSGTSKAKGFQGAVKRHGFSGASEKTHGQRHTERAMGSIGMMGVAKVFKGKKMPGRMGGDRVTEKSLKVVDVDKENNTIVLSGAVPGRKGTILEIKTD